MLLHLIYFFVYISFFISGFSALIYEILWVRVFSLTFGHTAVSVSAVLASFMAGLSLGSFLGGRLSDKINSRKLLKLFSLVELLTAITAIATYPLIKYTQSFILNIGILKLNLLSQSVIWFSLSFIIILIPTTLMGTTLPILTKWFSYENKNKNADYALPVLYGLNTLGAILGVLMAGFFFIYKFGISNTFYIAGFFNLVAALVTFKISTSMIIQNSLNLPPKNQISENYIDKKNIFFAIILLTGAAAMICEVAWTRTFAMILGSSTYAFSIMLATILSGFAIGSLIFSIYRKYYKVTARGLSIISMLLAIILILYLPMINLLPYFFVKAFVIVIKSNLLLFISQFILCVSIMIIPSIIMGVIFPWIIACINPSNHSIGSITGQLYSFNTIGNIIGSTAAGLLLLSTIGAEKSIIIAVLLYAAVSVICFITFEKFGLLFKVILGTFSFLIIFLLLNLRPPWDPYIISSGAFIYAPEYIPILSKKSFAEFTKAMHAHKILYYKDGITSTVAVFQTKWNEKFLRVNGKTDASTFSDMSTQLLSGYIPYFFHPSEPKSALIIGMGSGATAGTLSAIKEIKKIDIVEIEPYVMEASKYFISINRNVLENPKVSSIIGDGRHFLAATNKKYDLITSEPSNPWISGIASLFTKEAFMLAKKRLNKDGIFCQWLHTYAMSEGDFKMIMHTFASVFPQAMLIHGGKNDYFLLGSDKSWKINYKRMEKVFDKNIAVKLDLLNINVNHPFTFLAEAFALGDSDFRKYSKTSKIHSDDKATLEFSAPLYLHRNYSKKILINLMNARTTLLPENITGLNPTKKEKQELYNIIGESFLRSKELNLAKKSFNKALKINRNNARTQTNIGRVHNLQNEHFKAEECFRKALKIDNNYALAYFHLGMLYVNQGMDIKGLRKLEEGLAISPDDPMGTVQVATIYIKQGRYNEAVDIINTALEKPVQNISIRNSLIHLLHVAKYN